MVRAKFVPTIQSSLESDRSTSRVSGNFLSNRVLDDSFFSSRSLSSLYRLPNIEKAGVLVPIGERYSPNPEEVAVYDRLYPIYIGLYTSVQNAFDQIAAIQEEIGPDEEEAT